LGAPVPENLKKSRSAFRAEIKRCLQLKLTYLNFHPGAALDDSPEACLERIVESLLELEDLVANSDLTLLIECTAGQGSSVGHDFQQLSYIVDNVKKHIPIGVCVDTCHAFAAGYDIRDAKALEHTLDEFDRIVGLKYLRAFHVNDSMKGLGSHVDRHACLGEGELGIECFKALMHHSRTREIPKYLETPDPEKYQKEIALLRSFAIGHS
jgi:deoxyribonuclease-4